MKNHTSSKNTKEISHKIESKGNNITIPKSHPRAASLFTREKLVKGYHSGLVAEEGLMAHGRGEAFDYLIGEKTSKSAKKAIRAAALALLSSEHPVISVNGNTASLCPKEIVQLANVTGAKIEVNLFYLRDPKRRNRIADALRENGADNVLGTIKENLVEIPKLESFRRYVDKNGIYKAGVVMIPLEDGDRTIALKRFGKKKVITFDLNPLSRTSQTADITIVDNITRGMKLMVKESREILKTYKKLTKAKRKGRISIPQNKMAQDRRGLSYSNPILLTRSDNNFLASFDNKINLEHNIIEIQRNLKTKLGKANHKKGNR